MDDIVTSCSQVFKVQSIKIGVGSLFKKVQARKMVQWREPLAHKPNDLSLITGTHIVERGELTLQIVF